MAGKRSGMLTAGGVLAIIAGVIGVIGGIIAMAASTFGAGYLGIAGAIGGVTAGVISLVLGVLAILGGRYALDKKNFILAIVFGGVCGLLSSWLFGLLALIFIALSKKEFR